MAALDLPLALDGVRRRFSRAPWRTLAEAAARTGYLARGAVYLSIGALALLAALDLTPRAQGAVGALEAWGEWPPGITLLWVVGLGLCAFVGWRALQAVADVDGNGRSLKGLASRFGQAISGVSYAALALSVFGLLEAISELREVDDQADTRRAVGKALDLPFGDLIVAFLGVFVIGAAIASIIRAFTDHFGRDLQCGAKTRRWAGALARIGYFGRGVAFFPVGLFLLNAGMKARASEARGVGGALQMLEGQPFGSLVLSLTALGLLAFGAFAVVEGLLRPMRLPRG